MARSCSGVVQVVMGCPGGNGVVLGDIFLGGFEWFYNSSTGFLVALIYFKVVL